MALIGTMPRQFFTHKEQPIPADFLGRVHDEVSSWGARHLYGQAVIAEAARLLTEHLKDVWECDAVAIVSHGSVLTYTPIWNHWPTWSTECPGG